MHKKEQCEGIKAPEKKNSNGRVRIEIYGKAMIEKKVGTSDKTGRIYVPPGWIGHHVKVIRLD